MDKIFSFFYDAGCQRRFEEALQAGEYSEARDILEAFPNGLNIGESVKRARILIEGYRALADYHELSKNRVEDDETLRGNLNRVLTDDSHGTVGENVSDEERIELIEASMEKLRKYEIIDDDPEHLDLEIGELADWRELGTLSEVCRRLREIEEIDRLDNL